MFNKKKFISVLVLFLVAILVVFTVSTVKSLSIPETSAFEVKSDMPDPSFTIPIDDDISISVGIANECVSIICYLAGFKEYNELYENEEILLRDTLDYFDEFKNNRQVKKAIRYYKKIKLFGFSYDAPAQFATYISPDCHYWRTDYDTVKEIVNDRNAIVGANSFGNLDKLLEVTAGFYDAVDFGNYYKNHNYLHFQILSQMEQYSDFMKKMGSNYKEYFNHGIEKTVLNFSLFECNNNYGCYFKDGGKIYFEPKMGLLYENNLWIMVHEMSHTDSNPIAKNLCKNPQINDYLNGYLNGEKKKKLSSEAYSGNIIYMYELITRANTIRILSKFMSDWYIKTNTISSDNFQGFETSTDVAEMLREYEKGDYPTFADFEDRLTELYIQKFCNETN